MRLISTFTLIVVLNVFVSQASAIQDQQNHNHEKNGNAPREQLSNIKAAEQLVNEALYHELYGRNDERNEVLSAAAKIDSGNAQVNWQRGLLYQDNQWQSIEDLAAANKKDLKLREYRQLRNKSEDTEVGHLQMAQWCQRNAMLDQFKAHLARVIQINPNNAEAREAIGFVQVNGRWYSDQEIQKIIARLSLDQRRVSAWQEELLPLRKDIFAQSNHKRELAMKKLLKINDHSAIVPIELMFAGVSNDVDDLLIDHFANIECPDSTESLARFAVYHSSDALREKAASKLKQRDRYEYIPDLLSTLQTPIAGRYEVVPDSRGQIIYRHVFMQQLQDQNLVSESNRVYRRIRLPGGSRSQSRRVALFDAALNINDNTIAQNARNLQISQLNQRLCGVLRITTGEKIGDDPRMWWKWWNDENEVYYTTTKPTMVNRRTQLVQIVDQPQVPETSGSGQGPADSESAGRQTNQSSSTPPSSGSESTTSTLPDSNPARSSRPQTIRKVSQRSRAGFANNSNPPPQSINSEPPASEPPRSSLPPEARQSEPPRSSGTGNVSTIESGESSTVEVMATDGESAEWPGCWHIDRNRNRAKAN